MASQKESTILTSIEDGMQKIILNRPSKKNAITSQMYGELTKLLNQSATNEEVNVLILTGSGDFYSSGNDFVSYLTGSFDLDVETDKLRQFIDALISYPKLLIAIVNGPAIGIAATTLTIVDIVYASETVSVMNKGVRSQFACASLISIIQQAYFLTPFCKLGLSPEGCSSYTFPRIMGPSKAAEMLYFGEKLTAQDAAKIGFVSRVYRADAVSDVWAHIKNVSSLSKESLAATKRLLQRWNKKLLMKVNREELEQLKIMYNCPSFADNMLKFMTSKSKM